MNTISMPGVSASQPPGSSPSPQAPLALPAPPPLPATPYLQITGMVNAEVLADDEEYAEVCSKLNLEHITLINQFACKLLLASRPACSTCSQSIDSVLQVHSRVYAPLHGATGDRTRLVMLRALLDKVCAYRFSRIFRKNVASMAKSCPLLCHALLTPPLQLRSLDRIIMER